jgi:hypothetical protein
MLRGVSPLKHILSTFAFRVKIYVNTAEPVRAFVVHVDHQSRATSRESRGETAGQLKVRKSRHQRRSRKQIR